MKMQKGTLVLLLLSLNLSAQDQSDNSNIGLGGFGGNGGFGEAPTIECPKTISQWETLRLDMTTNKKNLFTSQVKSSEGENFNPMQDPRSGGGMMMGFGMNPNDFDPKKFPDQVFVDNPAKAKIQFCLDKEKFDKDKQLQVLKCMGRMPGMEPLIDPKDTKDYYNANKPIFEQSSVMSSDGKTPKITFRDPIMNDPDMYRKIDHPKTRDQAIKDLRAKVKKLGGEVFYDESAIGRGGFGRVEVMIPGKDGCDRHYSIQTAAPDDKSETPSGIKRLPVATVCMKDPFTGKKLDKPAGFLMFYDRNFPQSGEPDNQFGSNYPEEGIFPSKGFQTMHQGATNCKTCHVTPYLPFVGDSDKLPEADRDGFNKIKKRSNSVYPVQSWGMVREEDGQKYISEFFKNTDRGAVYGPTDSEIRDDVLNHCLQGREDIRSKIKKAMDCQSCHNGVVREVLTDSPIQDGGGIITGGTFSKYIMGKGMYAKHAMPPENKLDEDERRILASCLESELRGVQKFPVDNPLGHPEVIVEGNMAKWQKEISCTPMPENEDSDQCEDCPPKMDVHDDLHSNELFNISEITTNEGMVYVLPKDNSGADPEGNFGEMNLSLTELHDKEGNTQGFKRPVFSGICVEFCRPSSFNVMTDENGEFKEVVPEQGMYGLQVYDPDASGQHRTLNEDEVKILNNFIKEKLAEAKEDGGLFIKELIEQVGAEKLKNKHKVDGLSGATYVEDGNKRLQLPKELKGGFNTVATALLYAYDTQVEVKNLKK